MEIVKLLRIVGIVLVVTGALVLGTGWEIIDHNYYKVRQAFCSQEALDDFQQELTNHSVISKNLAYIPPAVFPLIVEGNVETTPDYHFPYGVENKVNRATSNSWEWFVPLLVGIFLLGMASGVRKENDGVTPESARLS